MKTTKKNIRTPRAVVFGGAGFLGSHVADALTENGYEVKIFDLKPSFYLRGDQVMTVGDIQNPKAVEGAVKDCDYVYNFAGFANLDDAATKALDTAQLNIIGNINILNAIEKAGTVKRYIYASTIYVYSEKGGFYRCSKQAAELYIEEYARRHDVSFTILRYGSLYGPRADSKNSIHKYIKQALTSGAITCTGSIEGVRDYVHVRDAANLSVKILEKQFSDKHIIISGLHPIKFREMILILEEILDRKVNVITTKEKSPAHYDYTPYSFAPKIGYKLTNNMYIDMGQGLLECIHEIKENELLLNDPEIVKVLV